eukprot:GHVL01003780.1.p2 GENE.GHVL01003780.1~~GHVL01003780.1.p2  ORF type:complete len:330 (-),score=99.20 GHVL01003780.1:383-1372(-)
MICSVGGVLWFFHNGQVFLIYSKLCCNPPKRFDGSMTMEKRRDCVDWFFNREKETPPPLDNKKNSIPAPPPLDGQKRKIDEVLNDLTNNKKRRVGTRSSNRLNNVIQIDSPLQKNKENSMMKNEDNSIINEGNSLKNEENSINNEENSVKNAENSMKNEENFMKNEETSVKNAENSIKNEENSMKNEENSIKNEENSIKNEENSMKSEENSIKIEKGGKVLLVSLKAGGAGLNLTVATRVYIMDPWWNPAIEDQAMERVHRIGQTEEIIVYKICIAKSVEQKLIEMHSSKKHFATSVLSGDGPMSNLEQKKSLRLEELKMLFSGSQEEI